MKRNKRTIILCLVLALVIGIVAACFYAYEHGFTKKWRNLIIAELAKNGIRADIGRLTIDPFNGLTARDVHLYSIAQGDRQLAQFSNLSLEIDLAKVVDRKDFLRTIRLRDADLSLPVNPDDPKSESIQLRGINASIHIDKEKVRISQAEGNIAGLQIKVRGSMEMPPKVPKTAKEEEEAKLARQRQWEEMKARRGALQQLVQFLDKLKSTGAPRPLLEVDVDGPLRDFKKLHLQLKLSSGPFLCGEYTGQELKMEGELRDSVIQLKTLELRDNVGTFKCQALWNPWKDKAIAFDLHSSMDLPALTKTLSELPLLREIVFYSPPKISAEGKYYIDQPWTVNDWPLELVGKIECDKPISSRGVIFDGFRADIGLKQGDFYLRNVALQHRSGSATGKFLRTKDGGVRYQIKWGMELKNVLPFVPNVAAQNWFKDFTFHKESYVSVEAVGAGSELAPESWSGNGRVDLKNFSHRDVHFPAVNANATIAGGKVILRDVEILRPEGKVTAGQINILPLESKLEIRDVTSNVYPGPILRCIIRNLEATVTPYQFSKPPKAKFNGTYYLGDPDKNTWDVEAILEDPVILTFNNVSYKVNQAKAKLREAHNVLRVEVEGTAAESVTHQLVTLTGGPKVEFVGDFSISKFIPPVNKWRVNILPPAANAVVRLGDKEVPLSKVQGTIDWDRGQMDIKALATVHGGSVNAELHWDKVTETPRYTAEILLAQANFEGLSRIFKPDAKAQGKLTGTFRYTSTGPLSSMNGGGSILLEESDVFSVPLLGPLSGLVTAILPLEKVIYSTAREAKADFTMTDGVIDSPNFLALTPAFEMRVSGKVDLVEDRTNLTARMNLRGIPGILLFPVSKILEYEAKGTLKDPGWNAKILPNLGRTSNN